jgi:hypothetical protein
MLRLLRMESISMKQPIFIPALVALTYGTAYAENVPALPEMP